MTPRQQAFNDATGWLQYRAAVCRQTEQEWAKKYCTGSRGAATERSARHELELAISELEKLASLPRRSRELRAEATDRERFLSQPQGEGNRDG